MCNFLEGGSKEKIGLGEGGKGEPYLELMLAGLSLRRWIEYVDGEDLAYVSTGWQMGEILLAMWVREGGVPSWRFVWLISLKCF